MADVSNGYRDALVRRQLTPGLISSLPGTGRLPPYIYFSTSYPELGGRVAWCHRFGENKSKRYSALPSFSLRLLNGKI